MKERPILFSAPMVRASLNGSKTQTRRIVKPRSKYSLFAREDGKPVWSDSYIMDPGNDEWRMRESPYGTEGDRLWVRENLKYDWDSNAWRYRADDRSCTDVIGSQPETPTPHRWPLGVVNSIHLPRRFSRLILEITGIRAERLQDISEADAIAEGIYFDKIGFTAGILGIAGVNQQWSATPKMAFANLWRAINGPGSWDANPWVWGVEFKRVTT